MRIVAIRDITAPIRSEIANAYIDFSQMTASVVAVVTDAVVDGKPVVGFGFNSNGRYAQPGLLRERFIPRLLAAKPETFTHAQVAKGVSAWRSAAWNVRRNVLDRLEVCGWVTAERRPTLRGTKAWRLNPIAAERFAGIAEAERLRREEGRARILGEVRDRPTKHENE